MNKRYLLMLLVLFVYGCQGADPDLANPKSTLETYLRHSSILINDVSNVDYKSALKCFHTEDREWFKKNYMSVFNTEGDYGLDAQNSEVKRQAYVFGEVVAKNGPQAGNVILGKNKIEEVMATDDYVILKAKNYVHEIKIVKEGSNWVIKGLFGITK